MKRIAVAAGLAALLLVLPSALASHTPQPTAVTIAGSLQSELGCTGDWQPDCAATHLVYDLSDDVWQRALDVPAGSWEYKAPLSDAWTENYGANATRDGANIGLTLGAAASVKFYYDHKSHWVTSNRNATIATVPGSFQSELGCPGDWDPGCLRSWLQDPDGNGTYVFETAALPAGSYEAKVAIDESWAENYGQGGVRDGANIPFTVPAGGATVTFAYDAVTHVLSIAVQGGGGPVTDNNVEWDGVRHDSRDLLYRTPGGAVQAGTAVRLRLRTFRDDVTAVRARIFDVDANAQRVVAMERVASDVDCYQASLGSRSCDFWEVVLPNAQPNNLWYRFIVTDGSDTDYYADNTPALDGGPGAVTDDPVDQSYALTVSVPGFETPAWARSAFIYQIFPDRFANGNAGNDPVPGNRGGFARDARYAYPGGDPSGASEPAWDQVVELGWSDLPEGYCRNYETPASECAPRFPQPGGAGTREGPRGRDYFGGDLQGVREKLDYLQQLGVTAVYLNPIFDAGSNHGYDTQDYTQIDPYFGNVAHWQTLEREAARRGIRLILDGVFNHLSSDSAFFDRYGHFPGVGACESPSSQYRGWFTFFNQDVPCGAGDYEGWFGFDSIPVLSKARADVQAYFLDDGIAKLWLRRGADGWRMDVSGDPSFPAGYWERFRQAVKGVDANALTISETWQKDTTLLRILRGDRFDTTMNYRLRDAVIGLLTPGDFDSKGFADSGRQLEPSEFAARLASIREDYADAAYYSLMNLLDSHDTERLLWALTPGSDTRADKEQNAGNLAAGKQRVRMASLIQFTVPGAPTVFYGDEVGLTGDDDPDDRRPYPWADQGGSPDAALRAHYQALAALRRSVPALVDGDFRILLADDGADTVAYGRRTGSQAAIVALNRSGSAQTLSIPVSGYVPDGTTFQLRLGGSGSAAVAGGRLEVPLAPMSGALLATGAIDLAPPAAPGGLQVTGESGGQVTLGWSGVAGAAAYNVYRSPVRGGGYVKANAAPVAGTGFTDTGLRNARTYYYVVRALDAAGNESGDSNEVAGLPHLTIGWANLQWPPSMTHTISAVDRTDSVYGQVWIDGVTSQPGATESLRAELGFGPDGSDPAGNAAWTWVAASFNVDVGNNDEFVASLLPEATGTYDYAYRYSTTNGRDWVYADLDGIPNGYSPAQAGNLTVTPSGDTIAPATPAGLRVVTASPSGIELAWDAVTGDPTLYGYEVLRGEASGGPYARVGRVTAASFADTDITEGRTYFYVVRSVDTSFNRSPSSAEVSARAELRTVQVVLTVTVPPPVEDAVGKSVYVAGTLNRLDGNLPEWNPAGVVLTRVDDTHWTITLTGKEGTQLEYKYTLGSWDFVEKDAACGETANRQLTLSFGASGTQAVGDTVPNWRNVAPCGN